VEEAQTIMGLCRIFRCLPSQVRDEDAEMLRLVKLEAIGNRVEGKDTASDEMDGGEF
jgi:hypothetical protein